MMLWLVFAALTVLVLVLLLVPLLRTRQAGLSRAQYDLTVYRDQLAELDIELDRGTLTADQAEAARTEIQRRILALGSLDSAARGQTAAPRRLAVVLGLVVPAIAFGAYLLLGSPGLPDQPYSVRAEQIKQMQDQGEMIRTMVASLSDKLEKNPNDGKGWAMLGRSLRVLGRKAEAVAALRKAVALLPADTQSRMELAGLLLQDIPQGSILPPEFVGLMREVLAVDPDNIDALYFAGIAAMQTGDNSRARDLWTKVMVQLPEGEDRSEIKRQIDGLR